MEKHRLQNFLMISLIVIGNIQNISAEDFLYHILNSKEEKLPRLSANWMAYIQKYLEKSIHKLPEIEKNKTVTDLLFIFYRRSNIFKSSSEKSISRMMIIRSMGNHVVNAPLFSMVTSLHFGYFEFNIWVSFNLDKNLKLNFTFNTLRAGFCDIRMKHSFVITSSINHESIDFKFCGTYSKFPIYAPHKSVAFSFPPGSRQFEELFAMDVSGSIFSAHVVVNVKMIMNETITSLTHFISHRSTFIHVFRIVVDKHMCVLVTAVQVLSLTIFDGPGIHSPHYNIFPYRASSFQCLLQVINHEMHIKIKAMVVYTGVKIPHRSNFINITSKNVFSSIYYDSGSQSGTHVYHISSPRNTQLNISLIYFSHSGRESTECQFGGIVFLEPSSSKMKEIFLLCNKGSKNNPFYLHYRQNIYVQHDSTIIIFSYKYYSHILTYCTISFTLCHTIHVNPCTRYEGNQNILKISISRHMPKCTIIDITPNYKSENVWSMYTCTVTLKFCHDSATGGFLHYTISGYYQKFPAYKMWIVLPHIKTISYVMWHPDGRRSNKFDRSTKLNFHGWSRSVSNIFSNFSFLSEVHENTMIPMNFWKFHYQWVQITIQPSINKLDKIFQINFKPIALVNFIRKSRYEAVLIKVKELGRNHVWLKLKGLSKPSNVPYFLETAVKFDISHRFHSRGNAMILATPGAFHDLEISLLQKKYKKLVYNWLLGYPTKDSFSGHRTISSQSIGEKKTLYHFTIYSEGVEYHFLEKFSIAPRTEERCTSKLISWNEAFNHCRNIGGYLPEFKSRKELEKFSATLKGSDAFAFEAIYIGLKER